MRGATSLCYNKDKQKKFQSTLPMRGATNGRRPLTVPQAISIHAPHAGSDRLGRLSGRCSRNFNPRSPCGERHVEYATRVIGYLFQSTLPMRGATKYTPSLRHLLLISIHAPHAGSDLVNPGGLTQARNFNPRSPCGERLWIERH